MFSFGGQQQQQQTGGLFGQPQASPSPFGVAPPLPGSQPGATGGGLFGASTTPSSTSLFGASASTQPASGGLFGQPSAATSPFGQPAPTGGMFGQQPAATSAFGQPASSSGGLFGAAQPAPSPTPSSFGGLGGGSAFGGGASGTSGQKWQTTRDLELNMKLVSISAMDYYKNKSLEELRWEDYQANRGQPGATASTPSGSAWGAQPSAQPAAGGMFGSAPAAGGMFGSTASAQPAGGLFGSTPSQPASGGLFGSTPSQPASGGFFGATAQAQPASGGLFGSTSQGQPASGGLFGSTPSQPVSGGLFGSTQPQQATGGLFGSAQSQPASGGLFGSAQPQQAAGGLFGSTQPQPATGGLFGSTPSTQPAATGGLFGSSQPATSGGLFGSTPSAQPSTGGGLFGSSPAAATSGGGLFGSTPSASTGGGLFGSSTQPAAGGLFGSTQAQPATTGGGLFGSSLAQPSTTGGGLFGTTQAQPGTTGGGLFGSTPAASTGGLFGSSTTPAGTGGLFGSAPAASGGGLYGSTTSTGPGGLFGSAPAGTGGGGLFGSTTTSTGGLFGSTAQPAAASGGLFGSGQATSAGSGLGFAQGGLFGSPAAPAAAASTASLPPVPRPSGLVTAKPIDKDSLSAFLWKDKTGESLTPLIKKKPSAPSTPPSPKSFVPQPAAALPDQAAAFGETETPTRLRDSVESLAGVRPPSIVVRPKIIYTTPTKVDGHTGSPRSRKSVLPVCANHNLWTKPSLEAMEGMTEQELARVEHFQIGQYGIGSVTWPGLTDVRFLNIDDIIQFKKGSVTLFPDEDLKPPVGTGLNKTAIIELQVRPKNAEVAKKYESRYMQEMKKLTESNGAEFMSYDLETWRFRVEHFSTWGIDESMWTKIDQSGGQADVHPSRNDMSLFSRLEKDLFTPSEDEMDHEEAETEDEMDFHAPAASFTKEDFVGALAVPPPTREELKNLGWDLKILDLFLGQSFRACVGAKGEVIMPEHPVLCDTYNVATVVPEATIEGKAGEQLEQLLLAFIDGKNGNWEALVNSVEQAEVESSKSVFSLIKALLSGDEQEAESAINTMAFNDWLSKINAVTMQADPTLAFSPAAALCSKDYSPSASELLINAGCPRLALAAAAAMDDTSRRLMKEQLANVQDSDASLQQVADVLGGHCERLTGLDWKAELALRYWFSDGDLNGFDPPTNSIEWRVIRAVVLGDSSEVFRLIDGLNCDGSKLFVILVALALMKQKQPDLVNEDHFNRVVMACSDFVLCNVNAVNWQLSPVALSLLPDTPERTKLIQDIVARNVERGTDLIEKLAIVDSKFLRAARQLVADA